MSKFKFIDFKRGWFHRHEGLVGLDGFSRVNNFVVYENAIEKVRGWKRLELEPLKYSDAIDSFPHIIDDFNYIIDSLNDSFLNPITLVNIEYPLVGPYVQSIYPYIKFEEENIRLGSFAFDILEFFGLVGGFNYTIDFNENPADESGRVNDSYGIIYTCDKSCDLISHETTLGSDPIIGGPAFRVSSGSTKDIATFYGMIYDPFKHQLVFSRWLNASVKSYHQIMDVINGVTYPAGTKLRATEITLNQFKFFVDDVEVKDITDFGTGIIGSGGTCFGMVKLLTIQQPVKTPISNTVGSTHLTSRFYVCNDGIVVTDNLIPVPDTNFDPTSDLVSSFNIAVKSGFNGETCFGILRTQLYNNGFDPTPDNIGDYFYADFLYERLSGHPRSGVFLRMDESKADPDDFTGWGVVIDGDRIFVAHWINQSLEDYGTIVAVYPSIADSGEGLSIEYGGWNTVAAATRHIKVYKITSSAGYVTLGTYLNPEAIIPKGTQLADRQANTNIGIGWLGNDAPGLHVARWKDRLSLPNAFPYMQVK